MFMIGTAECRDDAAHALCWQPPVAGRAGGGQGQARVRTPAPALARDSLQRTTATDINLNILNFSSSASSHNSAHGGQQRTAFLGSMLVRRLTPRCRPAQPSAGRQLILVPSSQCKFCAHRQDPA